MNAAAAAAAAEINHQVVRVGCSCFVRSEAHPDCILLGRRMGSHGAGKLALPGGHLEFGESVTDCVVREVKEETNLDVAVDPSVAAHTVTAINSPPSEEMGGKHYVTLFVTAYVSSDSAALANVEPSKCEGWNWVKCSDLDDMDEEELFDPLRRLLGAARAAALVEEADGERTTFA